MRLTKKARKELREILVKIEEGKAEIAARMLSHFLITH